MSKLERKPPEPPTAVEVKPLGMVPLPGCRCRCGHEWLPRDEGRPLVCPKCKSPRWDKPKLYERKAVVRARPLSARDATKPRGG